MQGILEFKNLFPKGKINVGQAMIFRKSPDGTMTIQLDVSIKKISDPSLLAQKNNNKEPNVNQNPSVIFPLPPT